MTELEILLSKIKNAPETVEFNEVISVIDQFYDHTPSAFTNGELQNAADQNQGSCKILAFAKLNNLTEAQTLACFGHFYRDEVLGDPNGTGHGNIRAFMRSGWAGVSVPESALRAKI